MYAYAEVYFRIKLYYNIIHCESEKTGRMMFHHNPGKCEPIYKLLSLEDSRGNVLCSDRTRSHNFTLN